MKKKFEKYWANVRNINIMLFIAMVLNTRCKLEYVDWVINESYDVDNAQVLKERVKHVLVSMFEFYILVKTSHNVQSSNQIQDTNEMEIESVEDVADFTNALYKKQTAGRKEV
uniref:hAT-like transposase RNase-H fold domain-containing protein n=1 Tax=Nelumbo nucifera TaxID=4432 RepID=A0A822ZJR4_NELNU|nr:TPA_asm: hypothetical protein HUJ06_004584 [Nelumbo nucifera]